jgi:hypothetical protein
METFYERIEEFNKDMLNYWRTMMTNQTPWINGQGQILSNWLTDLMKTGYEMNVSNWNHFFDQYLAFLSTTYEGTQAQRDQLEKELRRVWDEFNQNQRLQGDQFKEFLAGMSDQLARKNKEEGLES